MSTNRFTAGASSIAQVSTVQITANDITTTYKLTINGKVISVLGNAGGVNSTAADLAAAWTASTAGETKEATASALTDTVTLTGLADGTPFTVTSSKSGGTGTIGPVATPTTPSSPNDWSVGANWSLGVIPVNGDDVVLDIPNVNIFWGLDQNAVTLNSLRRESTFTGSVGLPQYNASGGYNEYRQTYLKIGITTLTLGTQGLANDSCARFNWDGSAVVSTITVYATGQGQDAPGLEACLIKNVPVNSTLEVLGGQVGVAVLANETATLTTLRVGGTAAVRCRTGVTLVTVNQSAGSLITDSAITTTNHFGGTHLAKSGALATLTIDGGNVVYTGTGAVGGTALSIGNAGTLDFSQDLQTRSIGSVVQLYKGATLLDPYKTTGTGWQYKLNRCSHKDVTLDLGPDRTYTQAA